MSAQTAQILSRIRLLEQKNRDHEKLIQQLIQQHTPETTHEVRGRDPALSGFKNMPAKRTSAPLPIDRNPAKIRRGEISVKNQQALRQLSSNGPNVLFPGDEENFVDFLVDSSFDFVPPLLSPLSHDEDFLRVPADDAPAGSG